MLLNETIPTYTENKGNERKVQRYWTLKQRVVLLLDFNVLTLR
jgi:hypothetical protein